MRKKKKESKTVVSVEQIMTIKCHVMNAGNFSQSSVRPNVNDVYSFT